jgi:hypothetical protein
MFFWFQSLCDSPMSKDEQTGILYGYIVLIDDAATME